MEVTGVEWNQTQEHFHGGQSSCAATEGHGNAAEGGPHESLPHDEVLCGCSRVRKKTASSTWSCGTELKQAHQHATEMLVKKKRKTADLASSDGGAGCPTTSPMFLKSDIFLLVNRNFACWGSVPAVQLKMILECIEKIACSALNLKVLLDPGQWEVAQ